MNFQEQYQIYRDEIEGYLQEFCKSLGSTGKLQEAMAYSLLGGGKRLRPVLTLAVCDMLGGDRKSALPFAAAVEMIHTYSLIHDDLPSMDDDDLRRGKATCHKEFEEATAILAGDALQSAAFVQIASAPYPSGKIKAAVHCLGTLGGEKGMVGGQALELSDGVVTMEKLQQIQAMKTGALLVAACHLGVIAADGEKETFKKITNYGDALGCAFQIRDDILDATGSVETLGKPIGSDAKEGTVTFYSLLGQEKAQAMVKMLTEKGETALSDLENTAFLVELIRWLAQREH